MGVLEATIKQNYLNNKDLLKEIHLSKNTYCSYQNPKEDHQYDVILGSVNEITNEVISQAKNIRAIRKSKEEGTYFDPESILTTDLVFRIMTWQHIPLLPPKEDKNLRKYDNSRNDTLNKFFDELSSEASIDSDSEIIEEYENLEERSLITCKADHIRLNFPPFFHYRLNNLGQPILIGKSHWFGPLDSGYFCKTHGYMTDTLATMIMKLTEKYALKGNWRNYSYREEMQGQAVLQLCQVALQFDESKSQNPFAFLTQISHNSFLRILNIEKKNQKLRDEILIKNNMNPSYSRSNTDANTMYDGISE